MRVLAEASSYILFELAGDRAGSASVVGTLLRPVLVPLRGNVDRVGIKLRPGAVNLLFGLSARDVRDRVIGLRDVSSHFPLALFDELQAATDFRARVRVVENWLCGELARLKPSQLAFQAETNRLFRAVARGAGQQETGIHPSRASASADLGYSDQAHMCREFRDFAGTDIGSLLSERRSVGIVQAAGQRAVS